LTHCTSIKNRTNCNTDQYVISPAGDFLYQFTETGTFYVWSGFVDEWGIKNYGGTIEVLDAMSSVGEVSVQVNGVEALHDVGGKLLLNLPLSCLNIHV